MSRLQHLSDVLERWAPVTCRANDSIDMINVPMPEEQLGALRTFADVWVGLPNPVDDAVWNLMRAFRGIHIYDAWFISRYAIHSLTFAQSEVTTNDAARRASAIVRALRKEMGVTPCVPTLISDITGEVSERLYACINKASTLEELIEYPSATVVFRSQSAALLEELLSVYQEHGYPHAYIGWLHGVGPRIFV